MYTAAQVAWTVRTALRPAIGGLHDGGNVGGDDIKSGGDGVMPLAMGAKIF